MIRWHKKSLRSSPQAFLHGMQGIGDKVLLIRFLFGKPDPVPESALVL